MINVGSHIESASPRSVTHVFHGFTFLEKISRLEESVEKRGEELRHAKEKLAMRESEITWMREENAQRAHALQAAVRNYTQPLSASP